MDIPGELDLTHLIEPHHKPNRSRPARSTARSPFKATLSQINEKRAEFNGLYLKLTNLNKKSKDTKLSDLKPEDLEFQLKTIKHAKNELKKSLDSLFRTTAGLSPLELRVVKGIKTIFDRSFYNFKLMYKRLKLKAEQLKEKQKTRKIFLTKPNRAATTLDSDGIVDRRRRHQPRNIHAHVEAEQLNSERQDHLSSELVMEDGKDVQEQNSKLRDVNKALDKVVNNFKKITEMVSLHDEMFGDIEMSTVDAKVNLKKGKGVLQKIHEDVSGNRKLILQFFGILIVIGMLYLLVL